MRADGEWRPTRSARSSRSAAESDEVGNYVRSAGSRDLDASLLLGALMDYPASRDPQMTATISALRRELGHGALLGRYSGEDGLAGGGGAFLCCSFWLADALARAGRSTTRPS